MINYDIVTRYTAYSETLQNGPPILSFSDFDGGYRKGSLYTKHPGTEKTAESLRCFYDRQL